MRTIFVLCGLILLAGGYFVWRSMQMPSVYGEFTGVTKVDATDIVEHPKNYLGRPISVESIVKEQCQSMGCFFFIVSGQKKLRVELKDIAMKAPMREGRIARVEGQIVPYGDEYQLYASGVEFK